MFLFHIYFVYFFHQQYSLIYYYFEFSKRTSLWNILFFSFDIDKTDSFLFMINWKNVVLIVVLFGIDKYGGDIGGYEGVWSGFRVIREEEMRIEKNEQWREFEESRLFGRNRSHWRKNRGSIQKENLIIILFPTPLFACSSETRPPAMSISLIKSLTSVCTRNTLSVTVPCCIRCFSDTPVKKAAKSTVKPPSSRKIARDNRKKLLQQEVEQYKKLDEIALKSGFPAPWKYYAAAYESWTIVWLIFL